MITVGSHGGSSGYDTIGQNKPQSAAGAGGQESNNNMVAMAAVAAHHGYDRGGYPTGTATTGPYPDLGMYSVFQWFYFFFCLVSFTLTRPTILV